MEIKIRLITDRLNNSRVPVTRIAYTDSTNGIEKFFSRCIIKINALRPYDLQGEWLRGRFDRDGGKKVLFDSWLTVDG